MSSDITQRFRCEPMLATIWADEFTRAGATQHEVAQQAVAQHIELEEMAEEVLQRFVALALEGCRELGELSNRPAPQQPRRTTLQDELRVANAIDTHRAVRIGNRAFLLTS